MQKPTFFNKIRFFFPIHLLFQQIKFNFLILFCWIFLFGIINRAVGTGIGMPYLFLSPEYLGETNVFSFLLLGAGIGGFIMAYHIYSYFQLGPRYPFIATLSRPFYKFSINNSTIPLVFMINLIVRIFIFQNAQEYANTSTIIWQIGGLISGVVLFTLFSFIYFIPTNKDMNKLTGNKKRKKGFESNNIETILHRRNAWYKAFMKTDKNRYFYVGKGFKFKKSRSASHYDFNILSKVFAQNHINASVFEIGLIITYIIFGFFKSYEYFQVPAAVSILLLFTILIMLISALSSWLRAWTIPLIIFSIFFLNYLSVNTPFFQFNSFAFGLSYQTEKLKKYDKAAIIDMKYSDSLIQHDLENYKKTLGNWKENTNQELPKLVIINTSGGGLRSSMWTFKVLQYLDSCTQNQFTKQVQLITGASGGMIGAAYYRDLILQQKLGKIESRLKEHYLTNISNDLLNRLSFAFVTTDLFFPFQRITINNTTYSRDRGYAFEQELIKNLDGALNHTLGYYKKYEQQSVIPTMIFTPTIINNGRRLLIGSQYLGFLQKTRSISEKNGFFHGIEDIEFLRFFAENQSDQIRFSTVLRMNASFPYIMPMVSMPTYPSMLIMDAGIRDNYGTKTTIKYLMTLEKWIKENTSGVVIVKIRDTKKGLMKDQFDNVSLLGRLFLPFGNMYDNFPQVQDFDQNEMLSSTIQAMDYKIDVVTFNLREDYKNKISLSWHLTHKEKQKIKNAVFSKGNTAAVQQLFNLLKNTNE